MAKFGKQRMRERLRMAASRCTRQIASNAPHQNRSKGSVKLLSARTVNPVNGAANNSGSLQDIATTQTGSRVRRRYPSSAARRASAIHSF